ncbi:MAG: hypothetical protein PHF79_01920 [Candidatus Pacebacteria bacterium]|nr:hypothetical protein [Candidatus Paceibacterota bacterium]
MNIFRAIGLGIGLIVIRLLVPEIFSAFEHTLLSFFHLLDGVFTVSVDGITNSAGVAASLAPKLPHAYVPSQ